ncbi:MAG: DHH family phosphoesterase [Oscillospiraceae bacterium]|nr:DHH family phosphoesterase [Oscillospiraceae bacterium]
MKKGYVSFNLILFIALLISSFVTLYFNNIAGFIEVTVVIILFWTFRRLRNTSQKRITKAISSISLPHTSVQSMSVLNVPLPACIVKLEDGEILWSNPAFGAITKHHAARFEISITRLIPDFPLKWLMEDKTECPFDITIFDRVYKVVGTLARHGDNAFSALLHWVDITDLTRLRSEVKMKRTVICVVMLDNYEEITKRLTENQKTALFASLDERIFGYFHTMDAVFTKIERDRYIIMFEEQHLKNLIDDRFSILERVREVTGSSDLPATLSIGLGVDGASPAECLSFANLALDMALSRGGDQSVIKNRLRFEFFGGNMKEMERRTKVKSRVMAGALRELINDASHVIIMGHKQSDIDSIGAACGLMAMARVLGKKSYIIADADHSSALRLIDKLANNREYSGAFINAQTALLYADRETLLIVVDTSRPEIVESVELLQSVHKVAVIDHHRRSETYIDQAALVFHEAYASSTCELVTELLQYVIEQSDLLRDESEGLLAGITMDTKNFSMHTGVRTFEAAAYLRAAGADTTNIKKMLQNDLESSLIRHSIVASAEMINDQITVAVSDRQVDRVTAAQAADDLLSISGVTASFVITRIGNTVHISGRSLGDINVQVIAEKLGGGGHQTMAGAQISSITIKASKERLIEAVDEYFRERG